MLVLTLLVAFDPVRLGIILLLISRPRPVQSLLAYWVGAMIVSVPYMLIPLTLLHVTPIFRSFAQGLAAPATFASPTVRHIQIGIGVVTLSLAALMTAHFWARRRTQLPTPDGNTATLVPDSNKATAISPLLGRAQNAPAEDESAIRRLLRRGHNAWESGSSWVALVIGLGSGPPPLTVLLVLTTVMASGAAIGAQVSVALAWIVVMFAVVEIILVSYLATPAKTQAVLRQLHNWSLAHSQQVVVAMLAVIGVALVTHGMGGIRARG